MYKRVGYANSIENRRNKKMSEQKGKFGKKHKVLLAVLATVAVGGSMGLITYNNQVQAERVEQQKKEEADKKAYIQLKSDVKQAVQSSYDTRNDKQIELAESLIEKLKEADQKYPKERMTKLHSLLNQVKTTEESITKAEKTKKEEDIKTAEKNIEAEKDSYLANDKKAHSERLNKLKKELADKKVKEKEEADKKAKDEQEKAKQNATETEEAKTPEVTPESTPVEPTVSEGYVDIPQEAPSIGEENYNQAPVETAQAPVTPVAPPVEQVQPAQPTPQPPAQGNNNGGGRPDVPLGGMTQEQLDEAAREDAGYDGTKDPNSPWFQP